MDQSFFLRAQRLLRQRRRARLDHAMLLAAVAARQDASPTAIAQQRVEAAEEFGDGAGLMEIVLASPDWRQAVRNQRGCIARAVPARDVNDA